jgi:hypothetical protein
LAIVRWRLVTRLLVLPLFGEVELRQAQALLRDPEIRVADVAKRLGVSEATLYRHLPGGRAGVTS